MLGDFRVLWAPYKKAAEKHTTTAAERIALFPIAIVIGWAIADIALGATEEEAEKAREAVDKRNPPPELSPLRALDLLMPTQKPAAVKKSHWPPFWGHKHGLGGGC